MGTRLISLVLPDLRVLASVQMRLNVMRNRSLVALKEAADRARRRSGSKSELSQRRTLHTCLTRTIRNEVCQAPHRRTTAILATLPSPSIHFLRPTILNRRRGHTSRPSLPTTIRDLTRPSHPLHSPYPAILQADLDSSWMVASSEYILDDTLVFVACGLVCLENDGN